MLRFVPALLRQRAGKGRKWFLLLRWCRILHRLLPKALFIQAECDGLVDDGLMYAKRLKDAGVPVECKVYEGMPHAFILRTYSETFEALDQICAFLKK